MLPGIGNLEGGQLLFSRLLAVDTNQRQSNIGTTPGRRLFPLMHSTWHFRQSSDQGFEVIRKCLIWPEGRVDPRHCSLQSSEVSHHSSDTRLQPEDIHGSFILHKRVDGVQIGFHSTSFCHEVLT